MKKKGQDLPSHIPRHSVSEPGAEVVIKGNEDGGVNISFSDGSEDLKVGRREFMRISGVAAASAAMAGSACRNDVENIVSYVDRPEETRIGMPSYYATVAGGVGVLVTARAGRPVKLEGNPNHPLSHGALNARTQASYMNLYDPDRARTPLQIRGETTKKLTWEQLNTEVVNKLKEVARGGNVRILTGTLTGSAQRAFINGVLAELPNVKHYVYDALTEQTSTDAYVQSYGEAMLPRYRFDKADVIVSLQNDFLGTWLNDTDNAKKFASRRDPDGKFNKLIAFEGMMTLTGSNADERHRVRTSHLPYIALALAHELTVTLGKGGYAGSSDAKSKLAPFTADAVAKATGVSKEAITETAKDLADHIGSSLVVAGGTASAQAGGAALEAAVNFLNAALEAPGNTLEFGRTTRRGSSSLGQIKTLVDEMNNGDVDVLIISGTNPVYSAPKSVGFEEALKGLKVPIVLSLADRVDETAQYANYLAPASHYLESWGDAESLERVYSIQQPVIRPLYKTQAPEETLLRWFTQAGITKQFAAMLTPTKPPAGNHPGDADYTTGAWYKFVRQHWDSELFPMADTASSFDEFWEAALRKGVWMAPENEERKGKPFQLPATLAQFPDAIPAAAEGPELVLFPTVALYDGEAANNGHLQELPDPITKHTWGSFVMVSAKTFTEKGYSNGDVLELQVSDTEEKVTAKVIMVPGMHDDVYAFPLGYGRTKVGVVGDELGENGFSLAGMDADTGRKFLSGLGVKVTRTDKTEKVYVPQGSQLIDLSKRDIMSVAMLKDYEKDPSAGIHKHPPLKDFWKDHDYGDLKWGMAVDLSKCTGCGACTIACQEENNTPVVGPQGIVEGREMHWIRVDRYYRMPMNEELLKKRNQVFGDPMYASEPYVAMAEYMDNPKVIHQPIMCQHCENAPCETVCPVLATMHSSDGLNQMAYNRCVGTRYCANNCPFKVRRFNWYNYGEHRGDTIFARLYPVLKDLGDYNNRQPLPVGLNPEVSVRERGVMEKCTFCVQRIRRAKWDAKKQGRAKMRDGDVVPACQQTCASGAIVFGNLLDENSQVHKLYHNTPRALSPLGALGVESSVAYLTRVYNTDKIDANDNYDPHHHGHGGDHGDGHGDAHGGDHKKDGHADEHGKEKKEGDHAGDHH